MRLGSATQTVEEERREDILSSPSMLPMEDKTAHHLSIQIRLKLSPAVVSYNIKTIKSIYYMELSWVFSCDSVKDTASKKYNILQSQKSYLSSYNRSTQSQCYWRVK